MVNVRITLLRAGSSSQLERLARRGGRWRRIAFPATFALLEHPSRGALLFDTGYAPRFFEATRPFPERLYRWLVPAAMGADQDAATQLAASGIGVAQVSTVVLSHLHGDHIGGLRDFPSARLVASGIQDLRGATPGRRLRGRAALSATGHGFLPALLPDDFSSRCVPVEDLPVVATGLPGLAGGHDLLGDGSALAVPLPGHAPGHLGLWVPLTQGPPVLLVGDACWLGETLGGDLPPAVVLRLMGDGGVYTHTIRLLERIRRERPDVWVVPSHSVASVAEASAALGP